MNTVSQAFDSRAMPLAEPSTAPSAAYALWRWLVDRLSARASARQRVAAVPDPAREAMPVDSRPGGDPAGP